MAPPTNPTVTVCPPPFNVKFPDRNEQSRAAYRKLTKGYAEKDAINFVSLTKEEERDLCEVLVKELFQLVDVDANRYQACYQACIDKCVATRVIRAQTWSAWGGYRDFTVKLQDAAARTTHFKEYHILSAPSVIAAAAVKKLRNVDTNGTDGTTTMMNGCKVFEFANASVQLWKHGQTGLIRTDQPYTGPPLVDEKALIALYGNEAGTVDDDDVEYISTSRVTETRNRLPAMHVTAQLDQPWATLKSPTPEPPVMRKVQRSLERDAVVEKVGGLIVTATSKDWTKEKNEQLVKMLTEQMVAVLPADMKLLLGVFANMTKNEEIGNWVEKSREDKLTVRWSEEEEIPTQPRWSRNGALEDMLDEWKNIINTPEKPNGATRSKIRQTIEAVRYNYREQEQNATRQAQAKAMERVDRLSDTMNEGFQDMKTYVDEALKKNAEQQAREIVKLLEEKGMVTRKRKRQETGERLATDDADDENLMGLMG